MHFVVLNALLAQQADGFATRTQAILRGKEWRRKEQIARE
jgi:hypothetical protein